jgi:hypothetical protein
VNTRVLAVLAGVALLAGCTSSGSPGGSSQPVAPSGSSSGKHQPGKVHEVHASSCPLASESSVRDTIGMRLGKITRLRGGGIVSGCRFYALQGSPLTASEHLPGPNQPVLEIIVHRYGTAFTAANVVTLTARSGHNPHRVSLGKTKGACFQTNFYPKDHGKDWACAASKKRIEVVVRSVDTTGTFSTATILRSVLNSV